MTRVTVLAGALALVAAGSFLWSRTGNNLPANPLVGAAFAQDSEEVDTSTIIEMAIGDENAPVEVIEYASYTCPHCAAFHEDSYKNLKSQYIDTGKVRFIYREVYFDKYGLWASMIARCAGPDRFFGVNDLIYAGQSDWTRAGGATEIVGELRKIGRLAGLSDETLDACMSDATKAKTLVAWFQENVAEHDITATPSFIVNGKKVANQSWSNFSAMLDAEIGS